MKTSPGILTYILITLYFLALPLGLSAQAVNGQTGRQKPSLKLTFAGDIMAHSINYEMDRQDSIYQGVAHFLRSDDLSFANLEYPMHPGESQASFPSFNVHPSYTEAAIRGGFDVFSLANNHSWDMELEGLEATLASMEVLSRELPYRIWYSGIKPRDKDWEVTEITIKGWKIGFIALTQYSNLRADPERLWMADYRNKTQTEELLQWVAHHSPSYDLFILSYHGGVEYSRQTSREKRDFFLKLIEAGVDIVYGHHPHVLQPVELIHTSRGDKVILSSCGNFISGQNRIIDPERPEEEWSYTGDSALFRLDVHMIEGSLTMGILKPLLLGNLITADRDVVVLPLEKIATDPLYGAWRTFYQDRLEIMTAWLNEDFLVEEFRN
ncbi:MAG: CapA family protein [Spirochaetales bacterium]|nr:CapA family protein [Spirochaetales bacterium]